MRAAHCIGAIVVAAGALSAAPARADEQGFVMIDSTLVKPLGERGGVSNSLGYGGEFRVLDNRDMLTMSLGGFVALGQREDGQSLRDIYDFHVNVGIKPEHTRRSALIPFVTIGIDVLGMETRDAKGRDPLRGTTLGVNARAGLMGHLGRKWLYRASASYLGAIVPGTGDDLGGLVLQVGLGRAIFD